MKCSGGSRKVVRNGRERDPVLLLSPNFLDYIMPANDPCHVPAVPISGVLQYVGPAVPASATLPQASAVSPAAMSQQRLQSACSDVAEASAACSAFCAACSSLCAACRALCAACSALYAPSSAPAVLSSCPSSPGHVSSPVNSPALSAVQNSPSQSSPRQFPSTTALHSPQQSKTESSFVVPTSGTDPCSG